MIRGPRDYQVAAEDAVVDYWLRGGGNPLVDMATGTGKSIVVGRLNRRIIEFDPSARILNLVHVRELVEQNFLTLRRMWPDASMGIYSAGLNRRDAHHKITFASIQSVYKKAKELGPRHVVLVDEAHLVPQGGDGMYLKLLADLREMVPGLRVAGLSATPYRMDSGRLDDGEESLFDEVVYSYGIRRGIEDGWLAPLVSKASATEIDVAGVGKRGGEFIAGALEAAADKDDVTRPAVAEVIARGAERRSWLFFCTGVKHAHHVAEEVRRQGYGCEVISGETPSGERTSIINAFKAGRIRALANCNVLTTGFDAPGVDLIAMLRPTLSTGLYVQMIGRATRVVWPAGFDPDASDATGRREAIAESAKPNALILDFAGVVRRHGPVDTVEIMSKRKKGEPDPAKVGVETVRAKSCPVCESIVALSTRECLDCGHLWPEPEPKHEAAADDVPILSTELRGPSEEPVMDWQARRWEKMGSPDSLCVTYMAGLQTRREWVCPEHPGSVRRKFEKWWRDHHGAEPYPEDVAAALVRWNELAMPTTILTRPNGKWTDIVGRRFGPTPQEQAA